MVSSGTMEERAASSAREDAAADRSAVAWSLLILRVIVGTIFMAHGAQKVFGLWGGPGLSGMMSGPNGPVIGFLVSIGEFFGGLGIAVGFLSRFSSAANIVIMLGAILQVHGKNGFFNGNKGFEYNLALIGMLLPILIAGPGPFTLLRAIGLRRVPPAVE
jgi:putative oxidoreductase